MKNEDNLGDSTIYALKKKNNWKDQVFAMVWNYGPHTVTDTKENNRTTLGNALTVSYSIKHIYHVTR